MLRTEPSHRAVVESNETLATFSERLMSAFLLRSCFFIPLLLSLPIADAAADGDAAELQIHRTRAADLGPIQKWIAGLVPKNSQMRLPQDRAFAVLASPSTHASIARKIADHENESILIDQIDLSRTDVDRFLDTAESLRRHAVENSKGGAFKYEVDLRHNKMTVQGIRLHVDTLKRIAGSKAYAAKTSLDDSDVVTSPDMPDTNRNQIPDSVAKSGEPDPARPKFLRLPRGPIRVVPIRELDLLLIRARN